MVVAADDSRLARLEAQMEQVLTTLQDMRTETRDEVWALNTRMDQLNDQLNAQIDQVNTRIDRLTLAALGIGGGVIVALISLAGVLAAGLTQSGG